ncbi:DUF6088 family protein [Bacteroidota bacterium]
MSLSRKIRNRVRRINKRTLFSAESIRTLGESLLAISKELSRMTQRGELRRYSNGVYYRPEQSRFGENGPSTEDVLRFLMYNKGKREGYVTGERTYNYLGLTTQIPSTITIATNKIKRSGKFGRVMIHYVKSYAEPNEKNIPLLQILDTIKNIEHIQDASISESLIILNGIIKNLSNERRSELLVLVKKYPPKVRALTGLIVENVSYGYSRHLENLKSTIIGRGKYYLRTREIPFTNNANWNIYELA